MARQGLRAGGMASGLTSRVWSVRERPPVAVACSGWIHRLEPIISRAVGLACITSLTSEARARASRRA
jgi:hypothetical protein